MGSSVSGKSRRVFLATGVGLAAFVIAGFGIVRELSETAGRSEASVNTLSSHVAIKGYDPVGYFTEGRPVAGVPDYQVSYMGAVYQFASPENMRLFQSDPETYAPAYGGYCSYGVRLGMKYDIDPSAFEIVDGRLYLQLDPGTRHVWQQDQAANITVADEIWREIRDVSPQSLPLSQ